MSQRRDRMEVIFDILKIIMDNHNSIRTTPLLRYSNLSSSSFNDYFTKLIEKRFVKVISSSDGKKYVTLTDKGFTYIEKYEAFRGFIGEFEL